MTVKWDFEPLHRLDDVTNLRWMPKGKRIHKSTIYRWISRGLRGIRLQAVKVGGTLYVTEVALRDFFEKLAQVESEKRTPSTSDYDRASKALDDAGI